MGEEQQARQAAGLSKRSWSKIKREHQGSSRVDLSFKERLAVNNCAESLAHEPGLTNLDLCRQTAAQFGICTTTGRSLLGKETEEALDHRQAKRRRKEGAGRKTAWAEAFECVILS